MMFMSLVANTLSHKQSYEYAIMVGNYHINSASTINHLMINNQCRSARCLCATGIFLLLYSLAGTIVGYYFLNYYAQQLDITSHLDPDQQSCIDICGYYTRQKYKNTCCDFYSCRSKSQCQQQRYAEYQIQVVIYQVVLGISITYMAAYICYQLYKCIAARASCCLNRRHSDGSDTQYLANAAYNRFKTQQIKTTLLCGQQQATTHNQQMICSICLQSYEKDRQMELVCGHVFHGECIASWAVLKQSCPVCRRQLGGV